MINLNIEQTAQLIWKFVHNLQLNDLRNINLSDSECSQIDEIVEAAQQIINNKFEIYELINK